MSLHLVISARSVVSNNDAYHAHKYFSEHPCMTNRIVSSFPDLSQWEHLLASVRCVLSTVGAAETTRIVIIKFQSVRAIEQA